MAVFSNNSIRLRLFFDYPPPAVVGCRMCWLLVDLNRCRVVSDLESVIRERFEFSRGSVLNLFIEDCYLPHTESIHVVRDNDSVRVKVDCLAQVNGHCSSPETVTEMSRKKRRATEENVPGDNGDNIEGKKKKRKKHNKESVKQVPAEDGNNRSQDGQKDKKKKKKTKQKVFTPVTKLAACPKTIQVTSNSSQKPTVTETKKQNTVSSDSSSSEEDDAPKKPTTKQPTSTPATSKASASTASAQTRSKPRSSSSSATEFSPDEADTVKFQNKNKHVSPTVTSSESHQVPSNLQPTNSSQKKADDVIEKEPDISESGDEIQLVIRKPTLPPGFGVRGQLSWRGHGRGSTRRGRGSGKKVPGEGRGDVRGPSGRFNESCCDGGVERSYQTDTLTNLSVVLQNPSESVPKPDYSSMPLLAAPPQVGQKIVFKLLELTENYTPEVSDYKEGKIVSFDPTTKQIELELLIASQAPVEPGKFDLVYQNPDGSERVEYAVSRESLITERWESLLEPRLII
ncbi:coilin [Pholidichthys leucotaenia]